MIELIDFQPLYNNVPVFEKISLRVDTGNIACIMGFSGIGKTSVFNKINNNTEYNGSIFKDSEIFNVFQDSSQLFPWYSIEKNLNLVCTEDYYQLCKHWNLHDLLSKKPMQISAGQRQRFTLIRALCSGKKILLCDEPLSAVDGLTSMKIAKDAKEQIELKNITCIWITHNPSEACLIGDDLYILTKSQFKHIQGPIDEKTILSNLD